MDDPIPEHMIERFRGQATTWGEALLLTTGSQKNPSVSNYGTTQRPRLPKYQNPDDF